MDIGVQIVNTNNLITITSALENKEVGTQHDDLAQRFVFTRPEGYETDDLVLQLTDGAYFYEQPIGASNTFSIPRYLTHRETIRLQIAFVRGGARAEASNRLIFKYRNGSRMTGAPIDDYVSTRQNNINYIREDNDGNFLYYSELTGSEKTIQVGGGGGASAPAKWYESASYLVFGDSIAAGWWSDLRDRLDVGVKSMARASAVLTDFAATTHDGLPVDGVNNTLTNQVLRLIDEKSDGTYATTPDVILIAFGTNKLDSEFPAENIDDAFTSSSGWGYVSLDDISLVGNIGGCLRWAVEKLRADDMYPNAKIFVCSPPQAAGGSAPARVLQAKRDEFRRAAVRLSCGFIDVYGDSGIYGPLEVNAAEGRYLRDGIHPNAEGRGLIIDTIIAALNNVGAPISDEPAAPPYTPPETSVSLSN